MATTNTVVWIYFVVVSACLIQKGGYNDLKQKKSCLFYTKLMN